MRRSEQREPWSTWLLLDLYLAHGWVTQSDNAHRKMDLHAAVKMRQKKRVGRTARQLAAEYNVDISHVYGVLRGDTFAPQILVAVDDETYLSLHRSARKSRKTIAEYACTLLKNHFEKEKP